MEYLSQEKVFTDANMSLINTREKRYNNVKFSAELKDGFYVLTSDEGKLKLTIKDEIVLYIILKFRFCPSWLAQQWYKNEQLVLGTDAKTKLRGFIDFGLIYEFPSLGQVLLMPTEKLASIFGSKLGNFTNPPFNTITHTISEEQVMYECMVGEARYINDLDVAPIPYVSSLGMGKLDSGAFVVPECEYNVRSSYFKEHIEEFNDQEAILSSEILDKKIITTPDLKENKFTIHKKIDQYNYDWKVPDLAVMAPRKIVNDIAMPQSIALEVELTAKSVQAYRKIFNLYWDNWKFGTVVYLISDKKTKTNIDHAFQRVKQENELNGVDRTCDFVFTEFVIPYMEGQLISQ